MRRASLAIDITVDKDLDYGDESDFFREPTGTNAEEALRETVVPV